MLLVLAPHRSGTSLTTRMLECLDAVNSNKLLTAQTTANILKLAPKK